MCAVTYRGFESHPLLSVGHIRVRFGEVTEWPKVRDWKSRVPPKGTVGSTPTLSALELKLGDSSQTM